jgi:hypothetical protein
LPSASRWLSAKTDGRQLWDGRWRPFAESPLSRVLNTRQTSLCRVSTNAECPALGKEPRCREPSFTECGTRQSLLCRVPDKRHSAKIATLGKALDSGSVWLELNMWVLWNKSTCIWVLRSSLVVCCMRTEICGYICTLFWWTHVVWIN